MLEAYRGLLHWMPITHSYPEINKTVTKATINDNHWIAQIELDKRINLFILIDLLFSQTGNIPAAAYPPSKYREVIELSPRSLSILILRYILKNIVANTMKAIILMGDMPT